MICAMRNSITPIEKYHSRLIRYRRIEFKMISVKINSIRARLILPHITILC